MSYSIQITRTAEQDLNSAADHIEFVLHNPAAADDLLDEAGKMIGGLSSFPEKFALVEDPFLKALGIRFIIIKNYLAFYTISHDEKKIYIIRFLYGKRDWQNILKHDFSLN
jgi:plasmid stabilization system protein ParE